MGRQETNRNDSKKKRIGKEKETTRNRNKDNEDNRRGSGLKADEGRRASIAPMHSPPSEPTPEPGAALRTSANACAATFE